ncbi:GH92 family glycosyl hydrolase [Leifsonia sp. H3M29-4]|uniref:GH92 family glycosyl hydrolase n=1 Tax=Salinibacterium metalliresistens TaxID=3031321 RepID=UPI0023DAA2E2|nr:GH92 family glycosyl hydrolase [Salinibacterium metalliresistens]MDF1477985.1 GH92 family glycosyl hydrolase [Salinibacterium metalliresistens]
MRDDYAESFERANDPEPPPLPGLATWVDSGPDRGSTAALGRGFTGLHALAFRHQAEEGQVDAVVLASPLAVRVHPDSQLRYLVFPGSESQRPFAATGVSLDLLFDDGSRASDHGLRDQIGAALHPAGQLAARALTPDQWNLVVVDLGAMAGRTVIAVELVAVGAGVSWGWIDDVSIARVNEPVGLSPAELVDTRRGTNSSRSASRGNTIPATALPNGFNLLVPMTDATSQKWLYQYSSGNGPDNRPRLEALGISHQPSPWMGDRDQLAIMPARAGDEVLALPSARALAFGHAAEQARPHEYRVVFDCGLEAAMVPTMRGACLRFSASFDLAVIVDRVAGESRFDIDADGRLSGWVDGGTDLSVGRSRMFVAGRFDRRPVHVDVAPDRESALVAQFDGDVELRIATSYLSIEQAEFNLRETEEGYDAVRRAAKDAWDRVLGVIEVEGARHDDRVTLYSNLYRLNLYPNWYDECTPTGEHRYASPVLPQRPSTDSTTGAQVRDGRMAVNHGFWDTYRTVWPAYALLYPSRTSALIDAFMQQYRDSGWIARWSSPGHADLMTGTSADVAFADAIIKSVSIADADEVLEALLKSATVVPPAANLGRKGQAVSPFLGYVPSGVTESASWTTENAINDAGIAALAEHLARDERTSGARRRELEDLARYLRHRSSAYRRLFDAETGFLRARREDGAWDPPGFDPEEWGGPYTETNAWTFAFHAPHDGGGLVEVFGGQRELAARLDAYFGTVETGTKAGTYGGVIHEMTEARDVRLGQFGFSNQPAHAMPFLYLFAGRPWRTQELLRDVLTRLFRGNEIGQGYPGDEDNGEMSAWHLFGCLGLYPLHLGAARYAVTAPLFPAARVRLESGRVLSVIADRHGADRPYVSEVSFDGVPLTSPWIDHERIAAGGVLRFVMSDRPSAWGIVPPPAPLPSPLRDLTRGATVRTDGGADASALIDDDARTDLVFQSDRVTVELELAEGPSSILLYTLTCAEASMAPTGWELHGCTADGWIAIDVRRDERFRWPRQTRPFSVAPHPACSGYRLVLEGGERGLALAEFELLAEED